MGKSGVIMEKSRENKAYHNVIVLFKIYRSVSWRMQVQIGQARHHMFVEYDMTVMERFSDCFGFVEEEVDAVIIIGMEGLLWWGC